MLELKYDKFPVLETERLILREMTMDDAPVLFEMRTHPLMNRYTDRAKMKTMEEAEQKMKTIIEMVESRNGIAWAIELKESKKQIGDISFWRLIKEHYRAEIGYALLPEYWEKGIMSEAARCAIDYGFSMLNFHSIEANVNPNNVASMKLLEKMNFVREAYFRENYYYDGKFLDSAIYSLVNNS
ncbi:MAG: GNAT family N-acetyltransferase [Bacteroidota bacterium]